MKLNSFDLNKMVVFYEVIREQGISSAARKLSLTPSAVSQAIGHLERHLAVKLFERRGRRIVATENADQLFEYLDKILPELQETILCLGRNNAVNGKVRLGVFYGCATTIPSQIIRDVHQQHPQIEVNVVFGAPSELDQALKSGHLDFAINLFKGNVGEIYHHLLATDQLWLLSARRPPSRKLSFEELKKAPFIDYFANSQLAVAWINHHFRKRVRKLPITINAANSSLMVQLILEGVGIGVVASSIAKPYVEQGRLFLIRGKKSQLESPIWFKRSKSLETSTAIQAFENVARQISFL